MRLPSGKRLKWEPPVAMALVLALGLWLALGPILRPHVKLPPGASARQIQIGDTKAVLAVIPGPAGSEPRFQILMPGRTSGPEVTGEAARTFLGPLYPAAAERSRNLIFRLLNITSWYNLVWIGIGFGGQVLFSGRMFLQWLISERRRESVVTESFWWFSLTGALVLFSYFAWRQDIVGILGQASGIVIYARNLRLIYKHKRRARRTAAA